MINFSIPGILTSSSSSGDPAGRCLLIYKELESNSCYDACLAD
ncbi:MAG: hypothetical protein R2875_16970 [Desulfobacterales bacterium]